MNEGMLNKVRSKIITDIYEWFDGSQMLVKWKFEEICKNAYEEITGETVDE